ncbi:MAG: peptidylprolyl isomerase [Phycisphaerales bacterium]|nr:MAG: peptidylprolyl isomerase [Phycisphaerales bacterium]
MATGLILAFVQVSCTPPKPTDLEVTAVATQTEVVQGESLELQAVASKGVDPYIYRWNLHAAPSGVDQIEVLSELTSQTVTAGPFGTLGEYDFRVMATDNEGFTAYDFITITVIERAPGDVFEVSIDGPVTVITGEPATYSAQTTYAHDVEYEWFIASGEADLDPTTGETTTLTTETEGDVTLQIIMRDIDTGEETTASLNVEVRPEDELIATITGETTTTQGAPIELTAEVVNGSDDLSFAWRIVSGPGGLEGDDQATVTFTSPETGETIIEVEVTDNEDQDQAIAQATITIEEAEPVEPFTVDVDQPTLVTQGQAIQVTATVETELEDLTYQWRAESGDPDIDDPTSFSPTVTINTDTTTHLVVEVTATNEAGSQRTETADLFLVTLEEEEPVVAFEVEQYGTIRVRLTPDLTPITVANFLSYVDEQFYDGLVFHRIETGSFGVVQGGAYPAEEVPDYQNVKTPHAPIANEAQTALSNLRGTLAMARSNAPDSATSQFYFNTTDNTQLDGTENLAGYCVFGEVIEGLEVLDQISEQVETENRNGLNFALEAVIITSVRREPATPAP